jgi:diguanylate cyclase (GGDEF)-like protein
MNWPAALIPAVLVAVGVLMTAGQAVRGQLSRSRRAGLERLHELSDLLASGAPVEHDPAQAIPGMLHRAIDLLGAGYAEVMLGGVAADVQLWSLRAGQRVMGPAGMAQEHLPPPFPLPSGRHLRGAGPSERAFLTARGITEALLVPLRVEGSIAGHVLVGDRRSGDWGERRSAVSFDDQGRRRGFRRRNERRTGGTTGFEPGDQRLLETLANQSAIALRNGRLMERLHFEARHDELTGLPNRLYFRGLLEAAAEGAASGTPCAVMVLDLNGFKAVNDSLGHSVGDELLRVLAARFTAAVGSDATIARLGGDEFAVLAVGRPVADEQALAALAERVLSAFEEPVPLAGTRLRFGGALGIALGPEHADTGAELMRKADVAMYAAKSAATTGWRLYSSGMPVDSAAVLTLATDLKDALLAEDVRIVVQPLVDLETGGVHSFEALARWRHPALGEIAPEAFFAAAERSGLSPALSEHILDRALATTRSWLDAGHALRVSVNVAPRWLADPALSEQIALALARHQVPADLLCLELTELSAMADPRRTHETLARLREMGVHLSMDDFGTGYSSLTYLSRLPVDQIKIDRSFVQQLHVSERDRAIVRSFVDLGRNLGLDVVAEGVSDPATRRVLRQMGCRFAQGYLFSPPLAPQDVPDLLKRVGVMGWAATSIWIAEAPVRRAVQALPMGPRGLALPSVQPHPDILAQWHTPTRSRIRPA